MKKRIFAFLLAICISFGLMMQYPATAYATSVPLPTATVTNIENPSADGVPLNFAMTFEAVPPTPEQKAMYNDWIADYVLTISAPVRGVDGYLAGRYEYFNGGNWEVVKDPYNEQVLFQANEPVRIIQTFASMAGYGTAALTYEFIHTFVDTFDCGIYLNDDFWKANPGATVQLSLKLYDPNDPNDEGEAIGDTFVYEEGATEPHICQESSWQKTTTNHYKKECVYNDCPLKGNTKFFDQSAHTFGGDNTCTICGYIGSEETAAPKTGDTTHTLLWATLFVGGVALMWMQLNARKREMF